MSLDVETIDNLTALAEKWGTSKSEVVRRVLRKTREEEAAKPPQMTPIEALRWLRKNGMSRDEAEHMKEEIRLEREATRYWWDDRSA